MKPNVVSLDGWAGTQRYAKLDRRPIRWSSREYIQFHIPTYIGTSLSGQPNVGSDMDGIFGGKKSDPFRHVISNGKHLLHLC